MSTWLINQVSYGSMVMNLKRRMRNGGGLGSLGRLFSNQTGLLSDSDDRHFTFSAVFGRRTTGFACHAYLLNVTAQRERLNFPICQPAVRFSLISIQYENQAGRGCFWMVVTRPVRTHSLAKVLCWLMAHTVHPSIHLSIQYPPSILHSF